MRIKHTTVRLGMLAAALAAAAAFVGAIPANAAVVTRAPTSASAVAYPPVENTFSIWLTGTPNPNMAHVCHWQDIYLTAGEYDWRMLMLGPGEDENVLTKIYLASSSYEWSDCLFPQQGYYVQRSGLCPLNLPVKYPCVFTYTYPKVHSGTYTVGSWLDWLYL